MGRHRGTYLMSRVRAHLFRYLAPHASPAGIRLLSTCSRTNFACMTSCDSLRFTFRVSRAFQDPAVFRPELQRRIIDACEDVETGAQYHVTGNPGFVASLVRAWWTLNLLIS